MSLSRFVGATRIGKKKKRTKFVLLCFIGGCARTYFRRLSLVFERETRNTVVLYTKDIMTGFGNDIKRLRIARIEILHNVIQTY